MDVFDGCLSILTPKQLKFIDNLEKLCKSNDQDASNTEINSSEEKKLDYLPSKRNDLDIYFDKLEDDLDEIKKIKLKKILEYNDECNDLMKILNKVLQNLEVLQNQYDTALQKTNHVHEHCEKILNQNKNLQVTFNSIEENLVFYREYKNLEKKFYSPSVTQLIDENFIPSFNRLDECIEFFDKNSNYLEAEKYKNQFKELQNQVLIAIKNYIITNIQQNSNKILPQSNKDIAQGENVFTLFYGKFQNFSSKIKFLADILEKKENYDESYEIYLNECHQAYFNARELLITPVLTAAIDEMIISHKNATCSLMRNSGKMLLHISQDEHQLYFNFFNKSSKLLYDFIESLCLNLYNKLRPIVIKINHLETLAELCHIIRNEIIDDEFLIKSKELQAFSNVLDQLLQDIQERLIYRTNVFIQNDISGYVPVEGDLAYPEKLEMLVNKNDKHSNLSRSSSIVSMTSTINNVNTLSEVALISGEYNQFMPNAESLTYHLWYPTVRRTIMCLTKLFRSLEQEIFQSLAQDVISFCIDTLDLAAEKISSKKNILNGLLFKIKHLLILREQIVPFRIECTVREVSLDFNRVKNAAINLINRSDTIFSLSTNNGLLSFLFEVQSTPQVIEHVLDPQRIVDNKIKSSCELFINKATENVLRKFPLVKSKLTDLSKTISCVSPHLQTTNSEKLESINYNDKFSKNLDIATLELEKQKNINEEEEIVSNKIALSDETVRNNMPNIEKNGKETNENESVIKKFETFLNQSLQDANLQVGEVQRLIKIYLSNEDTVTILFKPIKNNIVKSIETFFNQVQIVFDGHEKYLNQDFTNRKKALEKIFS